MASNDTNVVLPPTLVQANRKLTIIAGINNKFWYTNYKGVREERKIIPSFMYFGNTPQHPDDQWLLVAWDMVRQSWRTFAIKDIEIEGAS